MLEKPALTDGRLSACLHEAYGVQPRDLQFLPLGADPDSAVYRLAAGEGDYFVKLRRGAFAPAVVGVPHLLASYPAAHVIAPIPTPAGRLHVRCDDFAVMLFPYVAGSDGYSRELSHDQWVELGRALRTLHALPAATLPPDLAGGLPQETFGGAWRDQVRAALAALNKSTAHRLRSSGNFGGSSGNFGGSTAADNLDAAPESDAAHGAGSWPWPAADAVAVAVADLLQRRRREVAALVAAAEELAATLQARALPSVLCHGDIHAGNVLLTAAGTLYVVDWDTVTFAPKERDLMFIGAGLGGWNRADQADAFYAGYGPCAVDLAALAYYRCARIVEDIALYCRDLLFTRAGGADRAEQLAQLASQFEPGAVVEIALAARRQHAAAAGH